MGQQKVETSARADRSGPNRSGDPSKVGLILTAAREPDPSRPSPALALQRRLGEALKANGRGADTEARNETQAWSARRRISFIFLSAVCLWIALGLAIRLLIVLL